MMAGRHAWAGGVAAGTLLAAMTVAGVRAGAGDPAKGKPLFEKCAACHAFDDSKMDGPTLKGMFGRKAGALDAFRYSAAMKRSDVVWDEATLDRFMADPQAFMRGNRMAFAGMGDATERADLIAYILEQAAEPSSAPSSIR